MFEINIRVNDARDIHESNVLQMMNSKIHKMLSVIYILKKIMFNS